MKVCIAGNCQAQHLEMMLGVANPAIEIMRLDPVFLMSDADKDAVFAKFTAADVIMAQRISDEYSINWIASAELRRVFGQKVIVWPNLYFDGYFPGVRYIYLDKWGKLPSPLGEYHFEQVRLAHAAGHSVEQALHAFIGEGLFDTAPDPINDSLGKLREREADVDASISDAIADRLAQQRQFYTPNHPINGILAEMLKRLTAHADIDIDVEQAAQAPYRLDECYIAASAAVVKRFNLPFDQEPVYRGRSIVSIQQHDATLGEARDYDARSLVEAYFRLYDAVEKSREARNMVA